MAPVPPTGDDEAIRMTTEGYARGRIREASGVPVVVDADGALVAGDLFLEGVVRLLAAAPLMAFALPLWLVKGRAALKRRVAREAALAPGSLVLNPAVRKLVADARAGGREVWLASAADELAVAPLAASVGASGCVASDGRTNLTGARKAAALERRFGVGGFDYVGGGRRDLAVWKRARRAIGVGLSARLARKLQALDGNARLLPGNGGGPRDRVRALRPHHWIKNVLVFLPLVAAHETRIGPYLAAAVAFAALCACASGTYVLNDLLDLPHDRQHPVKRNRALASGKAPPRPMLGAGAALAGGGLALGFGVSPSVGLGILCYLTGTVCYTLYLKRVLFLDVMMLALLYAVRIVVGAVAAAVPLSPWLGAFSLLIFIALAICKRQRELADGGESARPALAGRGYRGEDRTVLTALGAAAGFAAVVVLAMYIQTPAVSARYDRPYLLWPIGPLLVYWLGRMLLLVNRGTAMTTR